MNGPTGAPAVGAGLQLLRLAGLVVGLGVSQAEVTVVVGQRSAIRTFLRS